MHPLVLAAFLLSGVSGLTLEVVWTRMLEHVFGATTLAISTVLTCFMGGMALGSWLFGRYADKIKSPLSVYAIAEGIVGACAFVIPTLIHEVYPDLNRWMVANLSGSFWSMSLARFAAVAFALILPTTCMGATLPLLSRHFMQRKSQMGRVGSRIGLLYTINTTGAILGVFLATFALLPGLGLAATNRVAGGINLALCAAILVFRGRLVAEPPAREAALLDAALSGEREGPFAAHRREHAAVAFAFFLSGLASMNLQVVWNRAMAMVIGASVYSFSLVLIAFLVGIAAGSAVFSRALRGIANPVFALGLVELFIALAAMANYLYMDDLPRIFASVVTTHVSSFEHHVGVIQFIMFSVAALAVLPATFGMGATFPLTIRVVTSGLDRIGRDVGRIYAFNTLGAIAGSFLSAFVFVPVFSHYLDGRGMQTTFFVSIGIYAGLGVLIIGVSRTRPVLRLAAGLPAALLTLAFMTTVPAWDPAAMTIGVFRLSLMENALDEEAWGDPDIKYYHDGVTTTVSIELWGRHFALKNNGKVDASNGDDMPTQIMVSAYPLLLHPAGPEGLDVAVIGFGSGVTVGAALEFPVRHVDSVELENAVVEASQIFGQVDGEPLDAEFNVNHLIYRRQDDPEYDWTDPDTFVINDRLTMHNNDGRNFLSSSSRRYDVIISEPSNPWITGVSNMFTRDNFASAVQALKDDGIFCQWVQLYEMSPRNIKTIFRTFASVFPHVVVFSAEDLSSDTMMIGSFEPIALDLRRIGAAMEDERVRAELARAYIFSPTDVLGRILLASREEVDHYTSGPGVPPDKRIINTDDNAVIEFSAPRDLISYNKFAGYLATVYTAQWQYARLHEVITGLGRGPERAVNAARQAVSMLVNGRKGEAAKFLELAAQVPLDEGAFAAAQEVRRARRMERLLVGREGAPLPVFEEAEPTRSLDERQTRDLHERVADVRKSLEAGAHRDALERFMRIPDHLWRRGGPQMLLLKGYLHYLNADPADGRECGESVEVLSQLVREHPGYLGRHPEVYYYLSLCHDNALHFDKAVKNIGRFVDLMRDREERARIAQAQAQANLEAAIKGLAGTMPIELPLDPEGAPTTDAQGESPKCLRVP